jgi:catechol 2,3-dioxygenase-like lactoylglutathione lyase family enzyme
MPHGLDHLVHVVRDLDAAADFYVRAGFTVSGRNRHPWGTHNRIVQLKNCYIELLEVAEPDKIVPHGARFFSFGAFNRDFLALREGFSMVLLNSLDAWADARAFEAGGIAGFDVFDFAREGTRPDGTVVKLAFSIAFAVDPGSPDVRFAACQHHFPENFWNPALQVHANGANEIQGVTLLARDPARHQHFLETYTGCRLNRDSIGIEAHTENGDIRVVQPAFFRDQFGIPVEVAGEGMTLTAVRIHVARIEQTEALLIQNGLAPLRHGERLILAQDAAYGATLIFEGTKLG